ncbi:hypothetical protein ACFFRR_002922 [Megaselia abdita]
MKMNLSLRLIFLKTLLYGLVFGQQQQQTSGSSSSGSRDLFKCRQMCYQKFIQEWHQCMDYVDCKSCWNNCDDNLGPFTLSVSSAFVQGNLVLTDIAWDQAITNQSKQCLVTWEVSGGGLMGNLLTDSSTVELSLWPNTVYNVEVTCKHKETGGMRRSLKLIVDTSKLIGNSVILHQPNIDINQIASSFPSTSTNDEDRRRILKDSSKDDFSSSYNPKIIQKYNKNQQEDVRVNEIHRSRLTTTTSTLLSMEFTSETVVLAMVGAFILFLIVVIGVMLATAHTAKTQLKSVGTSTTGSRRNLVTHEVLPNSDVQPIRI